MRRAALLRPRALLLPFVALLLLISLAPPGLAQVPGATQTTSHHVVFQVDRSNLLLPGVQEGLRTELKRDFVRESDDLGHELTSDLIKVMLQQLGVDSGTLADIISAVLSPGGTPTMPVTLTADVGGYFEFKGIGGTSVDMTYPVTVTFTYPDSNTFGCGQEIEIQTAATVGPGTRVHIEPPVLDTGLGVIIDNLRFDAKLDACCCLGLNGVCISDFVPDDLLSFGTPPYHLPDLPPLLTICGQAVKDQDPGSVLGCASNTILDQSKVFVTLNNGALCITPSLPGIPEMQACAGVFDPNSLQLSSPDGGRTIILDGTTQNVVNAHTDLIDWAAALEGSQAKLSFGGALTIDPGDINATWAVDTEMRFALSSVVSFVVDLGLPMDWQVVDPLTNTVIRTGTQERFVPVVAGETIRLQFPSDRHDPVPVGARNDLTSHLDSKISQFYRMGMGLNIFEITVAGHSTVGPIVNEPLFNGYVNTNPVNGQPVPDVVEQGTLSLGTQQIDMPAAIVLDPEHPVIDIDNVAVQDVLNIGGGERLVVYRVDIGNGGDVRLHDVQCDLDLGKVFASAENWEVQCVTSPGFPVNPDYDGTTDINLLGSNGTIEVGDTTKVEVLVRVKPEIADILPGGCFAPVVYNASAFARAVSPIGTPVRNNWDHCTQTVTGPTLVASVDLGAAHIDSLQQYAIYGWQGVEFARSFELSRGNVGSSKTIDFSPWTAQTSADPRIIGDLQAGTNVHVSQSRVTIDYAQITDKLFLNDPNSELATTGRISSGSDCAAVMPKPDLRLPAVDRNAPSVEVAPDGMRTLSPGAFQFIDLGDRAVLKLSGGEYDVARFRIGDQVTVLFEGPVRLNIHRWDENPESGLAMVIDGPAAATSEVFINYDGNPTLIFTNSRIQGTLLAPNAEVTFADGCSMEGACYANRVRIGPQCRFAHHDFLDDLKIDPECRPASGLSASLHLGDGRRNPGAGDSGSDALNGSRQPVAGFTLDPNVPNPFRARTEVRFRAAEAGHVKVAIFDLQGREVRVALDREVQPGEHRVPLDLGDLAPGVYFVRMQSPEGTVARKMIMLQ